MTTHTVQNSPRIAILGGGPGGYEAAMVAASLGAAVTVIERAGLGGSAVLTDVVPSKTLIATADLMSRVGEAGGLGVKSTSTAATARRPCTRTSSTSTTASWPSRVSNPLTFKTASKI